MLSRSTVFLLLFYLLDLPITGKKKKAVLAFSIIMVDISLTLFGSVSFCFMHFDSDLHWALLLGAYMFRIIISSWGIDLFIIMQYPFLSTTVFILKSTNQCFP